MTNTKMV